MTSPLEKQLTTGSVDAQHQDLINDVSFDWSGRRMATCSSDQYVKIWSKDPDSGQWVKTHSFHAHNGSVWKVTWANPTFGQVIATCSFDRKACVFEELPGDQSSPSATIWYKRYTFLEGHAPVTDVKFGPKREGMVLALASVDGLVRINEASNPFKLNAWLSHSNIRAMKTCAISSISWSTCSALPTLLAVGANGGREKPERLGLFERLGQAKNESENQAKEHKWAHITDPVLDIKDPLRVHDVAFAPSVGRCYHMLAVATNEIRVIKIERTSLVNDPYSSSRYMFSSDIVTKLGASELCWRLSWNALGTILGASSGDGNVKLWKQNYLKNWICISSLSSNERTAQSLNTNISPPPVSTDPNHKSQNKGVAPSMRSAVGDVNTDHDRNRKQTGNGYS